MDASSPAYSVVSASRRTDLVSCYPDQLIERLRDFPPERVHTIVVWTKNPRNILEHRLLRERLAAYSQLYIHLTVTGLGGSLLEPRIPPWQEVAAMLPGLIDFIGGANRISWRFDPVVRVRHEEQEITNFPLFGDIAPVMSGTGILSCRTSWVEPYRKVQRRMQKKKIELMVHTPQERRHQAAELEALAASFGITIQYCSMEGFERSRCIDGALFNSLHPEGRVCSARRAKGQRRLCGCTESVDIGWYSQKCFNGCLYCYAEPVVG